LLGLLGIENGDRIEAVNGYDMSDPENALSAYNSFRRKNDALVLLNRRGQTLSLHYRIV
jgi:general secretion pathway protein C